MSTGGLAPLPMRLGGTPQDGLSPGAHARLSLDVAAMSMTAALAIVEVQILADQSAVIVSCRSRGGSEMLAHSPAYVAFGLDMVAFTLRSSYTPPGSKTARGWAVTSGDGAILGRESNGYVEFDAASRQVRFWVTNQTVYPFTVWIAVWGDTEPVDAHQYGADENKRESKTEGAMPYAAIELRGIQSGLGSAYTKRTSSLVTLENIVLARMLSVVSRCAERHAANQLPSTAGQALGRWAKIMAVPLGDGEDWKVRQRCNRKMRFTASGGTDLFLVPELRKMFGEAFVQINRFPGTIDSSPYPTFWPAGDPGPAAWDLGDGVWSSKRCHLQVQLSRSSRLSDDEVVLIARTEMADMFSWALDSFVTWDWTLQAPGGFVLGQSILGRDSL